MNEHGMENEQSEQQKNSSNIEYLPTKCRVTKPPPPKPALNPLQFIKVQPTPIFHKVKQPTNEIGNIKKERKIIKDEAEDWQANLDNWKSSRRKLQGELIERVVEIKKFEQEDKEKVRRKSKTFNEILEERGKKYSIPIYIEESNDWSDLDLSNKNTKSCETDDENRLESYDYSKNENYQKNDPYSSSIDCNSNTEKTDTIYSNNDYTIESKSEQDPIPTDETYTYEGAIADYRSRIKPKKDDTTLFKISDMPKSFSEIETFIPKGEIEKRKEFFANQIKDNLSNNTSGRILQDFENSTSIKDRLKSLEKCTDQTVKYVDNVIIKKKVEQITQIFDKTCIKDHNLNKITQINNEKNINILPLRNKENISENDLKEIETQSDDKSSDSFYGCSEDANYPTSISSNDYMVLSSDREDSGIHTADVSSSVSQADDTAEDTISYDVGVNDFQARQKYFKNLEDNNNICCNNILKLTKENLNNQTNTDNINTILNLTSEFLKTNEKITDCDEIQDRFNSNEIRECDIENTQKDISPIIIEEKNLQPITSDSIINYLREPDTFPVALKTDDDFVFDLNFPLLPTKMIEPPNVKPPPPPIIRDDKSKFKDKDVISTKFTLESSPFGSSKMDDENENVAAAPEEKTKINDLLAEKFYQSDIIPATETKEGSTSDASIINMNNCKTSDDDEIGKKEREIIAMIEKAEKHQDEPPVRVERQHNFPPVAQKPTEPIYKHCDYFDDQDSEVLKVEKELQQLEQEELKRKRDSNLFNQGYSRVFTKNTRYSLDNIFDSTSSTLENRKSMPELQYLKNDKEPPKPNVSMFRALNDVDMKYRKSAPNIPGIIHPNSKVSIGNNFQTIENYERNYIPDIQRSAFEVPSRKPILPYKPVSTHNKNRKCIPPTPFNMVRSKTEPSFNKVVNQSVPNTAYLKTRPNLETKSYDQHWLYQEAELRRLQDQKKWQQCKYSSVPSVPNWIIKGPAIQIPESSKTSVRKLSSSKNVEPYAKHNSPIGSPLLSTSTFSEEKQNRILSVSGKKKCSYCGNELGRGAAMIVETLCLFYHMECFKCCVCHIQLGNGLNGTDVRVRNQKLHCRNCYSSDDGVKFSCV